MFTCCRCVVVLDNAKKTKQSHIFNVSKKTITSLAFSADGKHLVTGEVMHCWQPRLSHKYHCIYKRYVNTCTPVRYVIQWETGINCAGWLLQGVIIHYNFTHRLVITRVWFHLCAMAGKWSSNQMTDATVLDSSSCNATI